MVKFVLLDFLASHFATDWAPSTSDPYVIARLNGALRTGVLSGFGILSSFVLVSGIGVTALGIQVGVGVAKGELDGGKGGGVEWKEIWEQVKGKDSRNDKDDVDPFGY